MKLNSLKIIKYRSSYSGTKTDIMYERYLLEI